MVLARTARSLNAAGPPYCRNSWRMSGVFGQKLGRMKAAASPLSSVRYSRSSHAVFRHVKYVYDCWKPTFARVRIMAGRVNASARKITSGCSALTLAISHSQNSTGLVCGLSTRNTVTPWSIHRFSTRRTSW